MSNRGPDPEDARTFADAALPALRRAVADLSWLRARGYAETAALKLVGDHLQLTKRQRQAVSRCACTDAQREERARRRVTALDGPVAVDGFNTLITLERALGGGAVLRGRDGAHRDLAGIHGTWRRSRHTETALSLMRRVLGDGDVTVFLDAPISNSGRLAGLVRELGYAAVLVPSADPELIGARATVVTHDAGILDRCGPWYDAIAAALPHIPDAWVLSLVD